MKRLAVGLVCGGGLLLVGACNGELVEPPGVMNPPTRAAISVATCFDPVPDPTTAHWSRQGGGNFQPGPRLQLIDTGLGAGDYLTFSCADPAMFQGNLVLNPRLAVDPGFVATAEGNLGIHVTINDGVNQFRAVLFQEGAGSVRVKIALPGDVFSPGIAFTGIAADFTMTWTTSGQMVLSAANWAGGPPLQEVFNPGDVPQTNVQNLEFGTYGVAASSTTNWETLGLTPGSAPPVQGALAFTQFRIRDVNSNDKVRFDADYALGGGTDGINPVAEIVSVRLSTPAYGQFYPAFATDFNPLSGFDLKGHTPKRRWLLNAVEQARSGIEQLHLTEGLNQTGTALLKDVRSTPPVIDYSIVNVELVVGDDRLAGTAQLIEKPAGSGRWRLSPLGAIRGTVSSPLLGALSNVQVDPQSAQSGGSVVSTDGLGRYATTNVVPGAWDVTLANLPQGCTDPGAQRVTVAAGGSVTANFSVTCVPPMGGGVVLDPQNPLANFVKDGNQGFTPGPSLVLNDASTGDHIGFFADDPAAATGRDVDVVAVFRVVNNSSAAGVDVGTRFIVTDGMTSAIAATVTLGGNTGIGIAIGTDFNSAANYGAFVPVDWLAPVSLRLRRWASGDVEIMEVNGVAPSPRALVPGTSLPGAVRATASIGFGLFSDGAVTTGEFNQFRSEPSAQP